MVQSNSVTTLEAMRQPMSLDERLSSLKKMKNDVVGHDQRKDFFVRQGGVRFLVDVLSVASKVTGKRREDQGNDASGNTLQTSTLGYDTRLEAILILASLANSGPAFVPSLLAAGLPKELVESLHPDTPPRLIVATLKALRSLVSSWALRNDVLDIRDRISLPIFNPQSIAFFQSVLCPQSTTPQSNQQLSLVAEIISLSAADEATRSLLTNEGILDTLASLLVSYTVENKHIKCIYQDHNTVSKRCSAPSDKAIPTIIAAITAIIEDSTFRTQRFILCDAIRDMFLNAQHDNTKGQRYGPAARPQDTIEGLLPPIHVPTQKSVSFTGGSNAFPALGNLENNGRRPWNSLEGRMRVVGTDHANAVCGWLIFFARSLQGQDRLEALKLLAIVNNEIETNGIPIPAKSESLQRARERERQVALLAVPLAVTLVQIASEFKAPETMPAEREHRLIKERACEVLGLLIQNSKALQTAAMDAKAVKRVCPMLKKSFDNVTLAKPMWSPRLPPVNQQSDQSIPATCTIGSKGLPPEIMHAMRCRQSALEAIASLARIDDTHRKAIVEAGVVTCIIDSLKPFPPETFATLASEGTQITPRDGNTVPVILSACHAAKSMSRSVSLLRTSLIDAGIAVPMFSLLKHPDPQVQIAATDVCCNLVLEFSPMREDLLNAGAIKTLAEHAKQSEMHLRLVSLWALKHLVLSATKDIKIQCLEELGIAWIVGAIQGEVIRDAGAILPTNGGVSVGLSTANAAGEQVDLLNPSSMDVDVPTMANDDDDDELDADKDNEDGEVMFDEQSSSQYQSSQLRSTLQQPLPAFNTQKYLSAIKSLETNPILQAKKYDLAVQEQGLDFIRNLLSGDDSVPMLDYLLEEIGSAKFFALITDKLAPIPESLLRHTPSNTTATGALKRVYHPTPLILSAIHVLTHIANALPKHKSLLIAQRSLLNNWLPHFAHPDRRVRVVSVWAVNSLTWTVDESDRSGARQRAHDLRIIGVEAAVRALSPDLDLDVRERVKTAIRQIESLL